MCPPPFLLPFASFLVSFSQSLAPSLPQPSIPRWACDLGSICICEGVGPGAVLMPRLDSARDSDRIDSGVLGRHA